MIKPLPGWVLIEPEQDDNKTASGIMLPDSSQDVPMRGKILEVGKGLTETKLTDQGDLIRGETAPPVMPNQTVLFKKYSGQTVKHEGKELKLVEFKDLLAVIE